MREFVEFCIYWYRVVDLSFFSIFRRIIIRYLFNIIIVLFECMFYL